MEKKNYGVVVHGTPELCDSTAKLNHHHMLLAPDSSPPSIIIAISQTSVLVVLGTRRVQGHTESGLQPRLTPSQLSQHDMCPCLGAPEIAVSWAGCGTQCVTSVRGSCSDYGITASRLNEGPDEDLQQETTRRRDDATSAA